MDFKAQKALVTGASRGIGRAIAIALAETGAEVWGTSRNPEQVSWAKGVEPVRFDISSPQSVEISWAEAKLADCGINLLVNNAGSGVLGGFVDTEFSNWEAQMNLMLLAPMRLSQLVVGGWSSERPGSLVNVSSLATEYPIPSMSGYNVAKAGLSAFSESLLLEGDIRLSKVVDLRLGDFNTRFNESIKRISENSRSSRIWKAMTKHVQQGPPAELAARRLIKVLGSNKVGTIRVGSGFQVVVASMLGRFLSQTVKRAFNLSYYNLSKK